MDDNYLHVLNLFGKKSKNSRELYFVQAQQQQQRSFLGMKIAAWWCNLFCPLWREVVLKQTG